MKVFLVDAYDSFVFIISQYLESMGVETVVERNDTPGLIEHIESYAPDFCVLGPGPGHPNDSGYIEIIRHFENRVPLLGICLGHQAIGLAYGGKVICADNVMHGKVSTISNDGEGVYLYTKGESIMATRYHSLIIDCDSCPEVLSITSRSEEDGYIMGVRHNSLPVEGVQFHPESILTDNGERIFKSFMQSYCDM